MHCHVLIRRLVRTCSCSYVFLFVRTVFLFMRVLVGTCSYSSVGLFVRVLVRTCSYSYVRTVLLFVRVLIRTCSDLSAGLKTHLWAWKHMKLHFVVDRMHAWVDLAVCGLRATF